MSQASARHILVCSKNECIELKNKISEGEISFEKAASEHSKCPSGKQGGDLGSFSPGMMVAEFDQVVFNDSLGQVHGPVKTQFGYHLIEITHRD